MESKKNVLITGVLGGIGSQLARTFSENNYRVIGLDLMDGPSPYCDKFIRFDLQKYCIDPEYKQKMDGILNKEIPEIFLLINNAAVQILSCLSEVKLADWNQTMNVNLTGPLLLSQLFLERLERSHGSIINIASIHH